MNKLSFRTILATACLMAGFAFYSCTPNSGIGSNVLPPGTLNANFVDTSTVVTSLVLEDTVRTDNVIQPYYMLGSYTDPVFGPTTASMYMQFILPTGNYYSFSAAPSGATGVICDSVLFYLPFGSYNSVSAYGTLSQENVQVYLLNQHTHFAYDSAYYDNAVMPHTQLLAESVQYPNIQLYDSIYYPNRSTLMMLQVPAIKVKLPVSWGQHWLDTAYINDPYLTTTTIAGTAHYNYLFNNDSLQTHFPGFYVTVNNAMQLPGQGGICYINPGTSFTGVLFFYHFAGVSGSATSAYFGVQSGNEIFNHFDHDYSNAPFKGTPNKKDSVYSPNYIYVQAMGGVKTKIDFPYLKNWVKNGPIIVNRAEVDIPVDEQTVTNIAPPTQLYLVGINDTSTVPSTATFTLPDENSTYYGGTYDAFNHQYVFDIAEYVQNIMDGKTIQAGLYLVPGSNNVTANRVVGYGGKGLGTSATRMRLKLYYTPLSKKPQKR